MNIKKTILASAVAAALGVSGSASAAVLIGNFNALFTLLDPGGGFVANSDGEATPWYLGRTVLSGTLVFDTATGAGSGDFTAFAFFGRGLLSVTTASFQAIGNGFGGPGSLVLANMGFTWDAVVGIPVSLVMDAAGFFDGLQGGATTSSVITGGVLAATENTSFGGGMNSYTLAMGAIPMASTTWNTTTIGGAACTLGCNPSGTLGLSADTIGGSPMLAGPFASLNANFDILSIQLLPTPVPSAVWLFGSGLVGLIGVARRRKKV